MYVNTYAEECMATETAVPAYGRATSLERARVCLAELVRRAGYSRACRRYRGEIEIETLHLRRDGYTASGRYFGTGLSLYELSFDSLEAGPWWYQVRALSRKALRADLKRIFPLAKISR